MAGSKSWKLTKYSMFKLWLEEEDHKKTKALTAFGKTLQKDRKIHVNSYPTIKFMPVEMREKDHKPWGGIWYGCGPSWIEFISSWHRELSTPLAENEYVHEVFVNPNNMIFIRNQKDLEEFNDRYGAENFLGSLINWKRVEDDGYVGMDMCDHYVYSHQLVWLTTWSVSSGVIWNKAGLRGTKLIAKWDGEKYAEVN